MQDNTLLMIALSTSSIGLLVLLIISWTITIPLADTGQLSARDVGQKIRVEGIITRIQFTNSTTRIRLNTTCTIDVLLFERINISAPASARVQGTLNEDKGKKIVYAEEIQVFTHAQSDNS